MTVTGGCLCGLVTYTVRGAMRPVIACHCTQCRKMSGNYVTATSAPRDAIDISGAAAITWYDSSQGTRRGFCHACGSQLFWDNDSSVALSIFAGTIDGPTGLALAGHIYCADKGDYYEIADGLPRADQADPDLTTQVVKPGSIGG